MKAEAIPDEPNLLDFDGLSVTEPSPPVAGASDHDLNGFGSSQPSPSGGKTHSLAIYRTCRCVKPVLL